MANVTNSPGGTIIVDTAATIFATGTKLKLRGFTFTGTVGEIQNGAAAPIIRLSATTSYWFGDKPIAMDGLIVAAGLTGTFTLFLG